MPFDKWLIKAPDNNMTIVMKRNENSGEIIIGGHNTFKEYAEHIVEELLAVSLPENTHTQRGRFRYILNDVPLMQWRECIRILGEDFITERVLRHGRVM